MTLGRFYADTFRREFGYHAVWEPGAKLVPGDLGFMHEGWFQRTAHVTDYSAIELKIDRNPVPANSMTFDHGVTLALGAGGKGELGPTAKVEATLKIEHGGGVLLRAHEIEQRSIVNLDEALEAVPWGRPDYEGKIVLVAEVRAARRAALVVAENMGTTVDLTGKLAPIKQLDIADASVDISAGSGTSYRLAVRSGKDGELITIGLKLFRLKRDWIGRQRPRMLGAGAPDSPESPFEEISPYDPEL